MGNALVHRSSGNLQTAAGEKRSRQRKEGDADAPGGDPLVIQVAPAGTQSESVAMATGTPVSPTSPDKVGSEEASTTAAYKLQLLLGQLDKGELPPLTELRRTVAYAADILSTQGEREKTSSEDKLKAVKEEQVREWLTSTFTRRESVYDSRVALRPLTFKAVAQAVVIGQYIESIYREGHANGGHANSPYPSGLSELFEGQLDRWDFDIFKADTLTNHQPLRYLGHELFKRHDLLEKYKISSSTLDAFLMQLENGYGRHGNPYHNTTHAADVVQTVHYLVHCTGLEPWLSGLEVLAVLLAALIHDVEHTGTTNTFHIQSQSEYALCYNDRSVLENHHLHTAFKLLKEDNLNILKNLSADDFSLLRSLVIDMVLATDMSSHFDHLKQMRQILSTPNAVSQLKEERSKVFCLLLHMADISHPAKPWGLHHQWIEKLFEEFFHQGDLEREVGRECSPLCDRETTFIPQSQIGFIDYIVRPAFDVCGDMLELLLSQPPCGEPVAMDTRTLRVWLEPLNENKKKWKAQTSNSVAAPTESEGGPQSN